MLVDRSVEAESKKKTKSLIELKETLVQIFFIYV